MPLISERFAAVKDKAAASSSTLDDLFLSPGSVEEGKPVRFSFVGDKTVDYYQGWATDSEDKPKALRFSDKPTDAELQARATDENLTLKDQFGNPTYMKLVFCAFVWNYSTSSIQILQVPQVTIQETLASLLTDEDVASDPSSWDFELSRTGQKQETRYTLVLKPGKRKGTVAKEVDAAWAECEEKGWNLEALLVGGDPTKPAAGLF